MGIGIEQNYNKSATVQRLDDDESGIGEEYANYLVNIACHIQPLDDSFGIDVDGSFGKSFLMFCGVNDILEGDKIIVGSDSYKVVGVDSYEYLGEKRHMELIIRKYIK